MFHEDDDVEIWADPAAPSSGRSHPGDDNDNENGEGEVDTHGGETGIGKGTGTKDEKGKGHGKGKGRGWGRETAKGKVLLNKPQGEMISLVPVLCSCRGECMRQTRTRRAP
jgi:hypothetical protein